MIWKFISSEVHKFVKFKKGCELQISKPCAVASPPSGDLGAVYCLS